MSGSRSIDAATLAATLSLFRTRASRFSDDPAVNVLAEQLDERYLAGMTPQPPTMLAVERFIDMVRRGEPPAIPAAQLAELEHLDLAAELAARAAHTQRTDPSQWFQRLDMAVFIVGSPRSGTSYLFNLLAAQGAFAFFTNASCWAWPTYGLAHTAKRPFADLGGGAFAIDTKTLKLDPSLVVPAEAEDIFHRAIPCYIHLGGHRYEFTDPALGNLYVLDRAIAAHLEHFSTRRLLTKSPFNTFRVAQLYRRFGSKCRFIHICRNGEDVAASIRANRFVYRQRGEFLTPEMAWIVHIQAALRHVDQVPMYLIRYEDLVDNPGHELGHLLDWLGLAMRLRPPRLNPWATGTRHNPQALSARRSLIGDFNAQLGYRLLVR